MKLENFRAIINNLQSIYDKIEKVADFGVLCISEGDNNIMIHLQDMVLAIFDDHYNKEGIDWITWFIYETDFQRDGLPAVYYGKPICYDVDSLHKYIEKKCVINKKNN